MAAMSSIFFLFFILLFLLALFQLSFMVEYALGVGGCTAVAMQRMAHPLS